MKTTYLQARFKVTSVDDLDETVLLDTTKLELVDLTEELSGMKKLFLKFPKEYQTKDKLEEDKYPYNDLIHRQLCEISLDSIQVE